MELPKLLLTKGEIAECLGIAERTVTEWVNDEDLPVIKIKGSVRFSPKAVQEWIDRRQELQASKTASSRRIPLPQHQLQ